MDEPTNVESVVIAQLYSIGLLVSGSVSVLFVDPTNWVETVMFFTGLVIFSVYIAAFVVSLVTSGGDTNGLSKVEE